jgi:hypothetical protein
LLGYWFGAGKMNLINGMPHGPILQALTCRRWFQCLFVHLELSEHGFKQLQFPSFVEVINRFLPPQDGVV